MNRTQLHLIASIIEAIRGGEDMGAFRTRIQKIHHPNFPYGDVALFLSANCGMEGLEYFSAYYLTVRAMNNMALEQRGKLAIAASCVIGLVEGGPFADLNPVLEQAVKEKAPAATWQAWLEASAQTGLPGILYTVMAKLPPSTAVDYDAFGLYAALCGQEMLNDMMDIIAANVGK